MKRSSIINDRLYRAFCLMFSLAAVHAAEYPRDLRFARTSGAFNANYGYRFTIGEKNDGGPRLVLDNETTSVHRSVLVNGYVLAFGSIGTDANLVTVFERSSGREMLKLICYDPELSPDGRFIAFRRFFPRSTEVNLINDKLAVLTLTELGNFQKTSDAVASQKQSLPLNESIGQTIFPLVRDKVGMFFPKVLWNKQSSDFYFVWQSNRSDQYTVGKCGLQEKEWIVEASVQRNLTNASDPPETVGRITSFQLDVFGTLAVGFDKMTPPNGLVQEEALFDPVTLASLSSEGVASATVSNNVSVPWTVQKRALVAPVKIDPIHVGADLGITSVRILITERGRVSLIHANLDKSALESVRAAIMSWQFKPTVLDGAPTAVSTIAEVLLIP